eukprot:755529-Hanusia_phi.AAC.7
MIQPKGWGPEGVSMWSEGYWARGGPEVPLYLLVGKSTGASLTYQGTPTKPLKTTHPSCVPQLSAQIYKRNFWPPPPTSLGRECSIKPSFWSTGTSVPERRSGGTKVWSGMTRVLRYPNKSL